MTLQSKLGFASALISVAASISLAGREARGTVMLDQSVLPDAVNHGLTTFQNTEYLAQTFTVGIAGQLDHVNLLMRMLVPSSGNVTVDIRPTVGGVPDQSNASRLASGQIDASLLPQFPPNDSFAWVTLDVSSAHIFVVPGEMLAIVATSALTSGSFELSGTPGAGYAGGSPYFRSGPSNAFTVFPPPASVPGYEHNFQTYVNTPEPSTIFLAVLGGPALLLCRRRQR